MVVSRTFKQAIDYSLPLSIVLSLFCFRLLAVRLLSIFARYFNEIRRKLTGRWFFWNF